MVDPGDPDDPVLTALQQAGLMVWIEGDAAHTEALIRRFDAAPKPMYYRPEVLDRDWAAYLTETGVAEDEVDPDAFVRWIFARALADRQPRYAAMARNWGVSVTAAEVAAVRDAADFVDLVALALDRRGA